MKLIEECISLSLSIPKNNDSLLLPVQSDSIYYCSLDDNQSSVVTHSKFDSMLKDKPKVAFLLKKHMELDIENVTSQIKLIPKSDKSSDGEIQEREIVEYGRLAQNKALNSVFILDNVLLPLLRQEISSNTSTQESNLRSSLHLTYAKKFASRVCRFTEQHKKGLRIQVPVDIDLNYINEEGSALKALQKAATEWVQSIGDIIESETHQSQLKDIKIPMEEVDFWRRRHVVLSGVLEQVKSPEVKNSIEFLRLNSAHLFHKLQEKINDLTKLSVEATENAKFLSTLERHLRTLVDGNLDALVTTIPSLIDGMRMVWTVSRHYNRDERMVPLMEMIANQISLRVKKYVKLKEIMDLNQDDSICIISKSTSLLEIWKISYMETRTRIESMGQGQRRWEFDRTRLFETTDYMVDICSNLLQAIKTIDELKYLLGPDLKRVTNENDDVFILMKEIESLPKLLKDLPFDPFDKINKKHWIKTMETFHNMVSKIEKRAGLSIETAFRRLRSSEGAFCLVRQFKTIKSCPSIHHIIEERYQDILQQYEKELESIENHFMKYKEDPPISFGHQTASGSIAWANDLYHRAKRPILLFQQNENLLMFGLGLSLKNSYLRFARSIDTYKERVYNDWKERAQSISNQCLRRPLLTVQGRDEISMSESTHTARTRSSFEQSVCEAMPIFIQVPTETLSDRSQSIPSVEIGVHIQTNFSHLAKELIDETKHFDALGYFIPQGAMHLTLQEQTIHSHVVNLDEFTKIFNSTFESMSSIELNLMETQVKRINTLLSPGLTTLNWSSQCISTYITAAFHAIENFRSKLREVRKHLFSIEKAVKVIGKQCLIITGSIEPNISIGNLADIIEEKARDKIAESLQKYQSISSMLIKIEMAVSESDKGSAATLQSSYSYWSKRVYNALIEMICRSIFSIFRVLWALHSESPACHFHITVIENELNPNPSLQDISKFIGRCSRIITESSKQFSRWMHQTCLDLPAHVQSSYLSNTMQEYSFYTDVSQNLAIISTYIGLNCGVLILIKEMKYWLQKWKKYFKNFYISDTEWKTELDMSVHSDVSTGLFHQSIIDCDKNLQYVQSTAFKVDYLPLSLFRIIDINDVRSFLLETIKERKLDMTDMLQTVANQNLESIKESIESYNHMLSSEPSSFGSFKVIMNGICTIRSMNMSMELLCKAMKEKFEVLRERGIFLSEEELAQVFSLHSQWYNLVLHAKTIDLRLSDYKMNFKEHLLNQNNDFKSQLKIETTRYLKEGPGSSIISLDTGVAKFDEWMTKIEHLQSIREDLYDSEDVLEMENTTHFDLITLQKSVTELNKIYDLYKNLKELLENQKPVIWENVDIDSFNERLDSFHHQILKTSKKYNEITWHKVLSKIIELKDTLPILKQMKHDSIKDRHWEQLAIMTNSESHICAPFKNLSFFSILMMNLYNVSSNVSDVINSSLQEQKIENGLLHITNYWNSVNLLTKKYGDGTSTNFVLGSMDEILIQLEDHMLNLQTMLTSKYSGVFRGEIKDWEKRLNLFNECLINWFNLQQKWMYLESIFVGADDIRMQLPKEAQTFDETSKAFQMIMKKSHEVPSIISACNQERLQLFSRLLESLERCQKSLSEYLNTKRVVFGRFYFISDEELISILGVSDPRSIEPHLIKLFNNTKMLQFSHGQQQKITHLKSSEEESVQLKHEIVSTGPVEVWMKNLDNEIKNTLQGKMKESIFLYPIQPLDKWINFSLGMCTISASQVWWTWKVEDAFQLIESGEKQALQNLETELSIKLSNLVTMTRSVLTDNTRRKVNTLLIIEVHARDIVSSFVRESILSATQFEWESQLRFYWEKDKDDLMIKQCIGSFSYGFEYLGLSGRLVITPLTDRCYITLTQALTFKLGGSPSGPAGTGKTETVKDLAKALGVPCFVINCGEGLDYLAMATIFAGLLQCGAWGCFDEFNRINIEVLSVVSSQLKAIQSAMISHLKTVNIGVGSDIVIKRVNGNAVSGIFITMNPGYAGRTELPDNLRSLFRPVAMISPDVLRITENMLFSEGFLDSISLARKVVALYKLAKEQLSKQYHYDFGLRSMKAVLEMAGTAKRRFSDFPEDELIMLVLKNANISRFIYEDEVLFCSFIQDLFPGLKYPEVNHKPLVNAIESYLHKNV